MGCHLIYRRFNFDQSSSVQSPLQTAYSSEHSAKKSECTHLALAPSWRPDRDGETSNDQEEIYFWKTWGYELKLQHGGYVHVITRSAGNVYFTGAFIYSTYLRTSFYFWRKQMWMLRPSCDNQKNHIPFFKSHVMLIHWGHRFYVYLCYYYIFTKREIGDRHYANLQSRHFCYLGDWTGPQAGHSNKIFIFFFWPDSG